MMPQRPRCLRIALVVVLVHACCVLFTSGASPPVTSSSVCQPLSAEFDFARAPPAAASDLAFCKEYRSSTCCDKSSTLAVMRQLTPLFAADSEVAASFSDRCRQISSTIACAPCHPDVGTRRRTGVCPSLCDEWYSACHDGLFTQVDGILRPCVDSSLVCAPLHTIVASGREFCESTGAGAGQMTPASTQHATLKDGVDALVRRSAREAASSDLAEYVDEDDAVACFDGSVPTGRTAGSTADSTSSYSESSSARKRYYKTAEEVAELERKRQARQANNQDEPMEQLLRSLERGVRVIVSYAHRAWSRLVRSLPVSRSVQRTLESSMGISVAFVLLQILLLDAAKRIQRCCKRRSARQTRTNEEVRTLRAEKLMQQQYAAETRTSGGGAEQQQHPKPKGTYTTIIDGEMVTLPE